jgi:hypothetical protein
VRFILLQCSCELPPSESTDTFPLPGMPHTGMGGAVDAVMIGGGFLFVILVLAILFGFGVALVMKRVFA